MGSSGTRSRPVDPGPDPSGGPHRSCRAGLALDVSQCSRAASGTRTVQRSLAVGIRCSLAQRRCEYLTISTPRPLPRWEGALAANALGDTLRRRHSSSCRTSWSICLSRVRSATITVGCWLGVGAGVGRAMGCPRGVAPIVACRCHRFHGKPLVSRHPESVAMPGSARGAKERLPGGWTWGLPRGRSCRWMN